MILLSQKGMYYRYRRFEKSVFKQPYLRCVVRHSQLIQRQYTQITYEQPIVHKIETFLTDEVAVSIIQALMGDDISSYLSTDVLTYYRNRIIYIIGLVIKDLGIKNAAHMFIPNQLFIVLISYIIAVISILLEKY